MTTTTNHSHTLGAPVVALHSSASNSTQWRNLLTALCDRHETFAFDLPGYGDKSDPESTTSEMSDVALGIVGEIELMGEPVHLVGHSYGGSVAVKISLMRPDLVKSLTLYEPAIFHLLDNDTPSDQMLLAGLRSIETSLRQESAAGRPDLGMKAFVEFWNSHGTWEGLSDKLQNALALAAPVVLADFNRCFGEDWTIEALSSLTMPVQVLMGMDSPSIAQRTATLVFESVQAAELVMLPGLGHMAPIHACEWVNPRISQHIARAERCAESFSWPQQVAA